MRAGKGPAYERWAKVFNLEQMAATVDYARTRAVFEEYKAAKYSRKYLSQHEADIELHRAVRATFRRILSGEKLPEDGRAEKQGNGEIAT